MANLNLKSLTDFVRLIQNKFTKEIPTIDPTIKASVARAASVSTAAGAVSLQEGIQDAVDQSFPQTQDGEFLELTGSYDNITKFPAQESSGNCAAPGVLTTFVPQDTSLIFNGNSYLTTADSTVQNYTGTMDLSFSAGLVTAVTDAIHSLATGLEVTISGATQPEYNGTYEITVLNPTTFTYEITGSPALTDAGSYSSNYAVLIIESVETGSDQNVDAGGVLTISLAGLDGQSYADTDGISGGLDEETEEAFRDRVLEAHNLTPGIATAPSIKFSAKQIAGVTRVFVVRPDGTVGGTPGVAGYTPQLGETVVYILRDNDPTIIPSQPELDEVKDQIIGDGLWPSFIPDEYLYVLAPNLSLQDFTFTSITPNTTTMQAAINEQLVAFFEDNAIVGPQTLELDTLNAFLRTVQDTVTGEFLTAFTYSVPASDMTASSGEILSRGTVSFV